jgi:hypothetical protein
MGDADGDPWSASVGTHRKIYKELALKKKFRALRRYVLDMSVSVSISKSIYLSIFISMHKYEHNTIIKLNGFYNDKTYTVMTERITTKVIKGLNI